MYSSCIYEGFQTLVTYPITFFKGKDAAGYLFLLLYRDGEDRRSCHFSSFNTWGMEVEEILQFIRSFSEENDIENMIIETYRPPPSRGHCVFPYSEVLLALPGNTDISEPLRKAGFREIMRIPCFEFSKGTLNPSQDLRPYRGTQKERQFYWEEWMKRPEALSIKDRKMKKSLFIESYLFNFPLFSSPDMVLFGDQGVVHWFPDVGSQKTLEFLSRTISEVPPVERVKLFRVLGTPFNDLIEQSVEYISRTLKTVRFQLDNYAARDALTSLAEQEIISNCTLLYERVIFSSP